MYSIPPPSGYTYKTISQPNITISWRGGKLTPQESFCDFCARTNDLKEIQNYIRINRINILRDSIDESKLFFPTLLHRLASLEKNPEIIQFFIDKGLNVNTKNSYGETPLFVALQYERYETAQIFLDNFTDVNIRDTHNKSVLSYFFSKYHPIVSSIIKCGYIVDSRYGNAKNEMTDLHFAVISKNRQLIEILLYNGWNPNALTNDGYTPLTLAVSNGDLDIAELLLVHGANPVQINFTHGTTLMQLTYEIEDHEIGAKMRHLISNFISPSLSQLVNIEMICFRQIVLDRLSIKHYRHFDIGCLADDWVHERISSLNIQKQVNDVMKYIKEHCHVNLNISQSESVSDDEHDE